MIVTTYRKGGNSWFWFLPVTVIYVSCGCYRAVRHQLLSGARVYFSGHVDWYRCPLSQDKEWCEFMINDEIKPWNMINLLFTYNKYVLIYIILSENQYLLPDSEINISKLHTQDGKDFANWKNCCVDLEVLRAEKAVRILRCFSIFCSFYCQKNCIRKILINKINFGIHKPSGSTKIDSGNRGSRFKSQHKY